MNYNLFVSEIIENDSKEIYIDLYKTEFVTPSGLCPLISFIKFLKIKFPHKKYRINPPKDNSVKNYLARICLFEHLNIKKFKVNKKPRKESLMELTQISYGDSSFERDSNIMNLIKKNLKCTDTTVNRIGHAVSEMVQNIIDHSESPVGGFMCAQVYRKRNPPVKLGVLHLTPIRLNFQLRFKAYVSPPLANYFWLPVNGSTTSSVSCSLIISSLNWFSIYSFILFVSFPVVST